MVTLSALHSMLIEMHGGMLTLATVCIIAVIIAKSHQRLRRTSGWYNSFSRFDSLFDKLAQYTDPAAYLAGIGGVVGLIAASIVGFYVWPAEALVNSSLGLTKVMFTIFATELWIMFVAIRTRYKHGVWESRGLSAVYPLVGLSGFFFMVLTGSFGGHMAGKGSVLDPAYQLLKLNPDALWLVGFDMIPVLIGVAFVEIVVVFAVFLRFRQK